jgi:transcriptional regulator with XRE-family HTH domain
MKSTKFRQSIHTKPYVATRSFLKIKREDAGLSNRVLGERLHTAYSLVAKVESGDRRLDVVEACKYCKEIGADPHELIDLIIKELDGN